MNNWERSGAFNSNTYEEILSENAIESISNTLIKRLYQSKLVQDFLNEKTESLNLNKLFSWAVRFLHLASRKLARVSDIEYDDVKKVLDKHLQVIMKDSFTVLFDLIKEDKEKHFKEAGIQIDQFIGELFKKYPVGSRERLTLLLNSITERFLLPYIIILESPDNTESILEETEGVIETEDLTRLLQLIQKYLERREGLRVIDDLPVPDFSIGGTKDPNLLNRLDRIGQNTEEIYEKIQAALGTVITGLSNPVDSKLTVVGSGKVEKELVKELPRSFSEMIKGDFLDDLEQELKIFEIRNLQDRSPESFALQTIFDRKDGLGNKEAAYEILQKLFQQVLEINPALITRIAEHNFKNTEKSTPEKVSELMLERARNILEKTGIILKDFVKQPELTNKERFISLLVSVLRSLLKKDNLFTKELNEMFGTIEFDADSQLNKFILENIFNADEIIRKKTFQLLIMTYFFPDIQIALSETAVLNNGDKQPLNYILLDVNDIDLAGKNFSNYYRDSRASVSTGIPIFGTLLRMIDELHSRIGTPRNFLERGKALLFPSKFLDPRVTWALKILGEFQKNYILLDLKKIK